MASIAALSQHTPVRPNEVVGHREGEVTRDVSGPAIGVMDHVTVGMPAGEGHHQRDHDNFGGLSGRHRPARKTAVVRSTTPAKNSLPSRHLKSAMSAIQRWLEAAAVKSRPIRSFPGAVPALRPRRHLRRP